MTQRIFAITKPGLTALAVAVAALWTCVGLEATTRRQADRDEIASIRTLERLRRLAPAPVINTPASAPMPSFVTPRSSIS